MIYEDKIRLRSDEELETQNEGLIILKNSLSELNIKYYLAAGTLLGAVREKNFIRWDWDVQLYLLVENAYPLKEKISEILVHRGFEINNYHKSKDFLKWDLNRKNVKLVRNVKLWIQYLNILSTILSNSSNNGC